ncbi:MAG: hypothetical protein O6844_07765 [Gammaproteobacteria bacterium]|nr:hypothetical protein [Gammaproteobacteria bacterium]MCZ6826149.1 hypothetical protein [Gammaproteobacteria bacterium]MCZ6912762.1 hypothetical protein [Pseudomonadota bacterium]
MSAITIDRFRREFILTAISVVALIVVMYLLNLDREANKALIIGLIPALPGLAAVAILILARARMDELERKIHDAALAFAFATSLFLLVAYGVLQASIAAPTLNWALAAALMSCTWATGWIVFGRLYR